MAAIKLPYGLRDSELIHISSVESGLSCACVCPSCGHPLVARKGPKTTHHFAHHQGGECAKAVETALHLAAKKILSDEKVIVIPKVLVEFDSYRESLVLSPDQKIELDEVIEEKRTEDIIPDLIAVKNGFKLFIEVHVTHEVDEAKLEKIRRLGISAIEIDLSKEDREFTEENLRDMVISNVSNRSWLYNVKAEKVRNHFLSFGDKRMGIRRGMAKHVDNCPIRKRVWNGKPYANLIDDCLYCEYSYEVGPNMSYVICGGRNKIKTYEDLRNYHLKLPLKFKEEKA